MTELGLARWMQEQQQEAHGLEVSEADVVFHEALQVIAAEEGMDVAELQLAFEDRGWLRAGGDPKGQGELPWASRKLMVLRARLYWLLDPSATAAVRTWTNYTLGRGVTFKAKDAGVNDQLQKFWKSPKNRTCTSAEGQRKHNRRLLIDGEVFFAVFDDEPAPSIRKIDCTEITQLIYDPDDREIVWAYERISFDAQGQEQKRYYRNWCFPTEELSGAFYRDSAGAYRQFPGDVEDGVLVYHMAFDALHQRGNSLFTSTISWLAHMRSFMQDRIAITRGLSKYIMKLTVKGGKEQLRKMGGALNAMSAPRLPGGVGPNVPPGTQSAAKTLLENEAATFSSLPRTTGAGDARNDFKAIRLMICAGTGMTEPYFGDAESGNLATATAMELPMLKQFQSHQQLWQDAWIDIFTIVMYFMGGNAAMSNNSVGDEMELIEVDVDFPPIVEADIDKLTKSIVAVCAEFPELKQPEVLKLVLTIIGLNNVDEVMVQVLKDAEANQAKADNIAAGLTPDGKPLPAPKPGVGGVLPTPVVGPAKPAQQQTGKPSAPIAVQQAVEALLHAYLMQETEEMNEAAAAD